MKEMKRKKITDSALLDLLNESETREEDETYQNPVDMMFRNWKKRSAALCGQTV